MRIFLALLLSAFSISAVAAKPGTLLVLNKADNTVSLLDLATKKSVATIPTGEGPHEVAVSPNGKIAVVCNYGSSPTPGNTLTVIDVAARKSLRTIDLGKYNRPHGIAWLRGNEVAVTTEGGKMLLTVDIEAGKVTAAIDTDQFGSHMVALAPAHDRAFVANIDSGSVSVIDLKQQRRIANITTGEGTEGIAISPDQREVWAGNRDGDTISIIDVASLKVVATLPSKSFPIRVKFTGDGKHVLVSNAQSGAVAVWDAATRREIRRINMQEPKASQWGQPDRHPGRGAAFAGFRRDAEPRPGRRHRSANLGRRRLADDGR
ncbi:MAG TPA: cytochrome D1 domain-containing protein [Steroidobacteraceae bacterium]|nr:cytochrome D1 domain-containing protein [Steroidobacteraceae bacterium]